MIKMKSTTSEGNQTVRSGNSVYAPLQSRREQRNSSLCGSGHRGEFTSQTPQITHTNTDNTLQSQRSESEKKKHILQIKGKGQEEFLIWLQSVFSFLNKMKRHQETPEALTVTAFVQ